MLTCYMYDDYDAFATEEGTTLLDIGVPLP
jgi:hypothetical protein